MGGLEALARRAIRRLALHGRGAMVITFVDRATMTRLHGQFLGQPTPTDVLTFRYPPAHPRGKVRAGGPTPGPRTSVIGEVIIAPSAARTYAIRHKIPYRQELARYLVHGLLHWSGKDDRTSAQQRTMRIMEDSLLGVGCRVKSAHRSPSTLHRFR